MKKKKKYRGERGAFGRGDRGVEGDGEGTRRRGVVPLFGLIWFGV